MNNNSPINFRFSNNLRETQRIELANLHHLDSIDIDSRLEKILTTYFIEREKIDQILLANRLDEKHVYLIRILFIYPYSQEFYDLFEEFDLALSKRSNKSPLTEEDALKRQIILIRNNLRKRGFESTISLFECLLENPPTQDFFLPFLIELWTNESLSQENQSQIHQLLNRYLSSSDLTELNRLKVKKIEQWILEGKSDLAISKFNLEPESFRRFISAASFNPLILAEFYGHLYNSQKNHGDKCGTAEELWKLLEQKPSLEFRKEVYQLTGQMFSDIRSTSNKNYFPKLFPILIEKFHKHSLHEDSVRLIISFCPSHPSSKKLNPVPSQKTLRDLKPVWISVIAYLVETHKDSSKALFNLKTLLSFVAERHIFDPEYLSKDEIANYLQLVKKLIVVFSHSINEAGVWIKRLTQYSVENLIQDKVLEKTILTYFEHEFSKDRVKDLSELLQNLEERVEISATELKKLWNKLLEYFSNKSDFDLVEFVQKNQSRLFSKDPKKVSLIDDTLEKLRNSIEHLTDFYHICEKSPQNLNLNQSSSIKTDVLAYFLLDEFQETHIVVACSLLKLFIYHLRRIDSKLLSAQKIAVSGPVKKIGDSSPKIANNRIPLKTKRIYRPKDTTNLKCITPQQVTITQFQRLNSALKKCIPAQSDKIDHDLRIIFDDLSNLWMLSSEEKNILHTLQATFVNKLLQKWPQSNERSSEADIKNLSFIDNFFLRVLKLDSLNTFFSNNVEIMCSIFDQIKSSRQLSLEIILLRFFLEFNKLKPSPENQFLNQVQIDLFKSRFTKFDKSIEGNDGPSPIKTEDYKSWALAITETAYTIDWPKNDIETYCKIFRKSIQIRFQWLDKDFFAFIKLSMESLSFKMCQALSNPDETASHSVKHYFLLFTKIFDDLFKLAHSSAANPSISCWTENILEMCGLILVELAKKWPLKLDRELISPEVIFWKMVDKLLTSCLLDSSKNAYTIGVIAIDIVNTCENIPVLEEHSQRTKYMSYLYACARCKSFLPLIDKEELFKKFIDQLTQTNNPDCIKIAFNSILVNFNEPFVFNYVNICLKRFLLSISNVQKNLSEQPSQQVFTVENQKKEFQKVLDMLWIKAHLLSKLVDVEEIQILKQHALTIIDTILDEFFDFMDNMQNLNEKAVCISEFTDLLGILNRLDLFFNEESFTIYCAMLSKLIVYFQKEELKKLIKLNSVDFIHLNFHFLSDSKIPLYEFVLKKLYQFLQLYHPKLAKQHEQNVINRLKQVKQDLVLVIES